MEDSRPGTTAISTVAVKSGDTRIVIALLKVSDSYKDWLELKVVEVTPTLTHLAESLAEAQELKAAHEEVITKIKSKTSPVEELYRRAGEVMSKECRPEVYSAMADSLSLVWDNVNSHLNLRDRLLQLNVDYFRCADAFKEKCEVIERLCKSYLPVEISDMQETITRLKELQREMLLSLSNALYQGNSLLQVITDICEKGTLDSRPAQIKAHAELAKMQVERWLEELHLRRHEVSALAEARSQEVAQCLGLALITADLALLRRRIADRALLSGCELGDTAASARLLLQEHNKLIPEAKEFQDQALKIVKATEEFASEGHFAGPEAIAEAYNLLELAAEYIHQLDTRESLLSLAVDFFGHATLALTRLDQLELDMKSGILGNYSQMISKVTTSLDEITTKPLQLGYNLLQQSPNAEGIKRTVEKLENKKINLNVLCETQKEGNIKAEKVYKNFADKYAQLMAFFESMEAYLSGIRSMGKEISSAKEFLQVHKTNIVDFQTKGNEVSAVVSLVPSTIEAVANERRNAVHSMAESLRSEYSRLLEQLELRNKLASAYVKVLSLGTELDRELLTIERIIGSEEGDEAAGSQAWLAVRQFEAQINNSAANFIHDIKFALVSPPLHSDEAIATVQALLQRIECQRKGLDAAWTQWLDDKAAAVRNKANWERVMAASNQTVDWVSKLDAQLYPILNKEIHSARQLAGHVEHKINTVLPEIRRAQQEIQLRIETAEALISKGDVKGSDGIPVRLKDLSHRLHNIATDYQLLVERLLGFFNNLSQVESKIESVQKSQMTHISPSNLLEAQRYQSDFELISEKLNEMMNSSLIESGHIISKIKELETTGGEQDTATVERAVETLRYDWQKAKSERERTLERDSQRCLFDADLGRINESVDTLSRKLLESRGHHGDDLASAKAARTSFDKFQLTISLLDEKIIEFVKSGEELLVGAIGEHVERELAALQRKWQLLKQQVIDASNTIDIAIKYFTLVEEAQEWFQEGNRILVSIIQQISTVTTIEEVTSLIYKINTFLKPGEEKQQQRIDEISRLAEKLQMIGPMPHVTLVRSGNKEMIDSFLQVQTELKTLLEKLDNKELLMEIDETDRLNENKISLNLNVLEPPLRTTSSECRTTSTVVHKIEVQKEFITTGCEEKEFRKSPTPPTKKPKFTEEKKPEAPYFTCPLQDTTILEGSKLRFECRVRGSPEPEIVWEKDGLSTDSNPDYVTKNDNGLCSLTIEETFAEDSARFTCRASNHAGSTETSAFLTVKECIREDAPWPPVFTSPLAATTVKAGEELVLQCSVEGSPLPTVTWSCDSVTLDEEPSCSIIYNNGKASLTKSQVKPADGGLYACTASNSHGTETSSAVVTVIVPKPSSEVPTFILGLDNVMARAGQKIKLECEVTGTPEPEITWTQDNKPLSREHKVVIEGGRTSLVIPEAFPKDAGVYRVTATSEAGKAETVATVTVKGRLPHETSDSEMPSDIEPSKPTIQLPLKDLSVFEGKKLRLDCVIIGQPEPEVIWYHNDRPVKESPEVQLLFHGDRCSLVIKETFLDDAGSYRVVAINSAGEASSSCTLAVQAVDRSTEGAIRQPTEETAMEDTSKNKPHFIKLLTDVLAEQGEILILECTIGGSPLPTVTWMFNNNDIQQSDRTHMMQDGEGQCSLRISGVSPEDRGVYAARAVNQLGEAKCFAHVAVKTPGLAQSGSGAQLDRREAPAFVELFADRTVPEGNATKFECIVTGRPSPKIRWLFNDAPVSGKDLLVSTSGNRQVLTIPAATKALAGKISCVAESEAGKATCSAQLNVTEDLMSLVPSSLETNQQSSVFEMKRSVFTHSSTSSQFSSTSSSTQPHVEVKSISSHSEMAASKIGDKPESKIESLRTSEYSNIDGVESQSQSEMVTKSGEQTQVKMIKPQRKSQAPRFVSPLQGCIVDQGADVTLEAIVEGFPSPSVSWSKNGSPLPGECETTFKLNRAILKMTGVTSASAGRYSLTAANEAGTAASTADVVVRKSSFPPVMGRRLQAGTALIGERVALEVEVTGTPTPTVNWFKDDIPIAAGESRFRRVTQGNCFSLIIDKADFSYSGRYSALATNSAGEAKSTADLLIVEPPHQESSSFSTVATDRLLETKQESTPFEESVLKPMLPIFSPGKSGVTVKSESFTSEKQVSMTVERAAYNFESVGPPVQPKTQEKMVRFDPQPVCLDEPLKREESNVVDDSLDKKSALDFFKSVIKENEAEAQKIKQTEVSEHVQVPIWAPSTESSFSEWKSNHSSYRRESIEKHDRPFSPTLHLEPGPPPEMGYIPKISAPNPKDDMIDRVKRLQDSHRTLSEAEVPTGGIKIYPFPLKKEPPSERPYSPVETVHKMVYPERKRSIQTDYSHKKEVVEDMIIPLHVEVPEASPSSVKPEEKEAEILRSPVVRPSADIAVRPLSPRPSAEGVSMEKLWSSVHKDSSHIEQKFHSESFSHSSALSEVKSFEPAVAWTTPKFEPLQHSMVEHSTLPLITSSKVEQSFIEKSKESSIKSSVEEKKTSAPEISSWVTPIFEPPVQTERSWLPKAEPHYHKVIPPEPIKTTTQLIKVEPVHPTSIRPISPLPSQQAISMEKKWGHKHVESKLDTSWPPPVQQSSQMETQFTSKREEKTFINQTFEVRKQDEFKPALVPAFQPLPQPQPVFPIPQHTVYYVAESRATHRANPPPAQISQTFSSSQESKLLKSESISKQTISTEDRNILPSQAKKIWSAAGPPVSFETRGFSKIGQFPRRSSAQELVLDDIHIEPGPPPEMGYATPPPKERRHSYVEEIEQELEKNLDKEPTRHLAGAVRTIPPPPKKERSVERQTQVSFENIEQRRLYQRSSSIGEDFKPFPQLEPFPFRVEPAKPKKDIKYGTVPRPSKFIKPNVSESDYESDLETTKIKARWTPWDSDVEEPTYRRVKPPEPRPHRSYSSEPEPIPSLKFGQVPVVLKSSSSFITDKQQIRSLQSETRSRMVKTEQTEGISLKPGSPPEYVGFKKPETKPGSPKSKNRMPIHESGYMADTDEPRGFIKETRSTVQQSSQWKSERMVQDKSDMKVPSPKVEKIPQELEPFPFKVEPVKEFMKPVAPPVSPSKFVKSSFKESDYESDYECRIKPMWRPSSVEPSDPTFKPVKPIVVETKKEVRNEPAPSLYDALPQQLSTPRIVRPEPQFVLKPGSPPKMEYAPPPRAVETSSSVSFAEATESSRRVVSMQQTTRVISYDQKQTRQQATLPHKIVPKGEAKWLSGTDSESDNQFTKKDVKQAEVLRLQRVEEMRKRLGEKTSHSTVDLKPADPPKFDYAPPQIPPVTSIVNKHMTDMSSTFKTKAHQFATDIIKDTKQKDTKVIAKVPEKEGPQCYREESRQSEKGAKVIDPDTGLIYFKYDFGYEFGVLMPGEGVPAKAIKEDKEGSIEVPVIHETTRIDGSTGLKKAYRGPITSESELSESEDRKRQPLLVATLPSVSSSIPTLSPYTSHSVQDGVHTNAWTDPVSSVVVNPMVHSDLPKRPPIFTTPLRDIAVMLGQTGRFECIVQAEPVPNVLWTKDGRVIEPSLTHEIVFRNGVCRLTINHPFTDDQGTYKCTATNNLGTAETTATLKVSGEAKTFLQ